MSTKRSSVKPEAKKGAHTRAQSAGGPGSNRLAKQKPTKRTIVRDDRGQDQPTDRRGAQGK